MGGEEVLCLLARYPDRLAAVVAMDAVADLAYRYREMLYSIRSGREARHDLTASVGGTPVTVPFQYAIRSPLDFARTLAFSHVPLQIWWSPVDRVVIDQATAQSGLLYVRIKTFDPSAPVTQAIHAVPHGYEFDQKTGLTAVVDFFRNGGRWLRRQPHPPQRWSYSSWLSHCSVWGYRFDAPGIGDALWKYVADGRHLSVTSPVPLQLRPPRADEPTAVLNASPGVTLKRTAAGQAVLIFPRGSSNADVN